MFSLFRQLLPQNRNNVLVAYRKTKVLLVHLRGEWTLFEKTSSGKMRPIQEYETFGPELKTHCHADMLNTFQDHFFSNLLLFHLDRHMVADTFIREICSSTVRKYFLPLSLFSQYIGGFTPTWFRWAAMFFPPVLILKLKWRKWEESILKREKREREESISKWEKKGTGRKHRGTKKVDHFHQVALKSDFQATKKIHRSYQIMVGPMPKNSRKFCHKTKNRQQQFRDWASTGLVPNELCLCAKQISTEIVWCQTYVSSKVNFHQNHVMADRCHMCLHIQTLHCVFSFHHIFSFVPWQILVNKSDKSDHPHQREPWCFVEVVNKVGAEAMPTNF